MSVTHENLKYTQPLPKKVGINKKCINKFHQKYRVGVIDCSQPKGVKQNKRVQIKNPCKSARDVDAGSRETMAGCNFD